MDNLAKKLAKMPEEKRLYLLKTLPSHLLVADDITRLEDILSNLDFIEAKFTVQMSIELLRDYNSAIEQVSANPSKPQLSEQFDEFSAFVRAEQHILSQYPELTLQQAANQPLNSVLETYAYEKLTSDSISRPWIKWLTKPQRRPDQIAIHVPGERIVSAALYPQGQKMFLGAHSGQFWRANLSTGATDSFSLDVENINMKSLASIPNSSFLLLGTTDGKIIRFNTEHDVIQNIWELSQGSIRLITSSQDGTKLITAHEGEKACLWNITDRSLELSAVMSIQGELERITSLTLALEDSVMVLGTNMGVLRMFASMTGWCQFYTDQEHLHPITSVLATDHGSLIWTGSSDCSVRCLRINNSLMVLEQARLLSSASITDLAEIKNSPFGCLISLKSGTVGLLSMRNMNFSEVWQHEERVIFSNYSDQTQTLTFADAYGGVFSKTISDPYKYAQVKKVQHETSQQREKVWHLNSLSWLDSSKFICAIELFYEKNSGFVIQSPPDVPDVKIKIIEVSSQHVVAEHKLLPTGSQVYEIRNIAGHSLMLRKVNTEDDNCGIQLIDLWSGNIRDEFIFDRFFSLDRIIVDEQGRYGLLFSGERTVVAWDLQTHEKLWEYNKYSRLASQVWIDSSMNWCGWVDEITGEICLNLATGEEIDFPKELLKSTYIWRYDRLVYIDENNTKISINYEPSGRVIKSLSLHDGRLLVLTDTGVLTLISDKTKPRNLLNNHSHILRPILLNSDLITFSKDNLLVVWETQNFTTKNRFPISHFSPKFVIASHETNAIALGANDGEVHILKLES